MRLTKTRLFRSEDTGLGKETITPLIEQLKGCPFRLEHIVSRGEASPAGFWYDQPQDEWVALLRGEATLAFQDGTLDLCAGDALIIPAHRRHRVAFTSADAVWLALHFGETVAKNPLEACT